MCCGHTDNHTAKKLLHNPQTGRRGKSPNLLTNGPNDAQSNPMPPRSAGTDSLQSPPPPAIAGLFSYKILSLHKHCYQKPAVTR
ncbi:hypothetical protein J6590_001691 [Homalodisca vitripennis]|nr:hypothetical protein J6590_001691 [Homalodisca vitripennis]